MWCCYKDVALLQLLLLIRDNNPSLTIILQIKDRIPTLLFKTRSISLAQKNVWVGTAAITIIKISNRNWSFKTDGHFRHDYPVFSRQKLIWLRSSFCFAKSILTLLPSESIFNLYNKLLFNENLNYFPWNMTKDVEFFLFKFYLSPLMFTFLRNMNKFSLTLNKLTNSKEFAIHNLPVVITT